MKKINLAIIGIKPLPQGGIVVLTRPGKENPSPNGSHVFNAVQAQRIATRVLGFASPFGIALLIQAVAASANTATLSLDAVTHKAGDAWENKLTGQKGTYGEKNEGKDWTEYRNQEIALGTQATLQLMGSMVSHAMNTAEFASPIAAPRVNKPVAITDSTPGTQDVESTEAATTEQVEA